MKKIILEERGYFWWNDLPIPPGRIIPNAPVSGLLKVDEEGRIELKLDAMLPHPMGILVAFSMEEQDKIQKKCIQGILKSSGKYVFLSGILMNGGNYPSRGIAYQEFLALTCLVSDRHFPHDDSKLKAKTLEIDLKGLEEWFRLGSINVSRTKSVISIKQKKTKDVTYRLEDGKLTIKYSIVGPHIGKSKHAELELKEKVSIVYQLTKKMPLDEIKTTFGLIEDLFILLTGSDYCLEWPIISVGKDIKCTLYFSRNKSSAAAPDWHECWTNFILLRDSFGTIFSTWKEKREIFGPGFYLYLGTRRGVQLYTEHRFVNLIWGIESFHRKKTESAQPSPFDTKIQRILGQMGKVLNSKDKRWLTERLEKASEPSLESRIFDTFKALPISLNEELLAQFAKKCAGRRNEISHYGGQKHDESYDIFSIDLNKKSEALSILYHILLLQEIGIDDQTLHWWVYEGFRSYHIKKTLVDAGLLNKAALDVELQLPEPISDGDRKTDGAEPKKTTILLKL